MIPSLCRRFPPIRNDDPIRPPFFSFCTGGRGGRLDAKTPAPAPSPAWLPYLRMTSGIFANLELLPLGTLNVFWLEVR